MFDTWTTEFRVERRKNREAAVWGEEEQQQKQPR
jgi:hypothetical protein